MKHESFDAVAVHPKRIRPGEPTMVGVWIKRQVPLEQQTKLMRLNETCNPGHIGVRTGKLGTAVMYLGPASDTKAARKLASSLVKSVSEITGATSILRQLPNYKAVSRALAV